LHFIAFPKIELVGSKLVAEMITCIGVMVAGGCVQHNFVPGAVETTGVPTDMAIDGDGFFIVNTPIGQAYTRDGMFMLDSEKYLTTADGYRVQGYGTDDNFAIVTDALTDLQVPLGTMSSARPTGEVELDGNLNADGTIGTLGTILFSQAFQSIAGQAATANTLLTDLVDPNAPGAARFAANDIITLQNVRKGGQQLPEEQFAVTADSTLGDFATFLQDKIGINQDPASSGTPGVRVSDGSDGAPAGTLVVEGNPGTANAVTIDLSSIRSSNADFNTPFDFTETQEANGESLYTSFIAYDSLGTPVQVSLTVVLSSKTDGGNVWRYYAESRDHTGASPVLGETGTLTFDHDGQLAEVTNNTIEIGREATGALDPMQIELNFDNVTNLSTIDSGLVMTSQDGFAAGTLNRYWVDGAGVITGIFSNGLTRPFGQITLATFTTPEGLIGLANNLYVPGPNSGSAVVSTPGQTGAGRVVSNALEVNEVQN
jgi:flagellar hook protein FlgE